MISRSRTLVTYYTPHMPTDNALDRIIAIKTELMSEKPDQKKTHTEQTFLIGCDQLTEVLSELPPSVLEENTEIRTASEDVLFMLSLGFLTAGLRNAPTGSYATLSTMHTLLSQLSRAPHYTYKELEVLSDRLNSSERELNEPSDAEHQISPVLATLISRKIADCKEVLPVAFKRFEGWSENQKNVFSQIVHIRRKLLDIAAHQYNKEIDLKPVKKLMTKLEMLQVQVEEDHKKNMGTPGINVEACNRLHSIMNVCMDHFHFYMENGPRVNPVVAPLVPGLLEINQNIELFLITYRWTLRETDLYGYKTQLDEYLDKINETVQFDPETRIPNPDFSIVVFLVRKARAMLFKILDLAEPVDDLLSPTYNQLLTTKRCLEEVRDMGGLSDLRELYPYQMKLASIDNNRKEGKFMVDGRIPAGQGIINAILSECFDLCHCLKCELEEKELDGRDEEDEEEEDDDEEDDSKSDDDTGGNTTRETLSVVSSSESLF